MNKNDFGAQLFRLRKQKGVTQTELAEHLHVTAQAVSKWECGTAMPDITQLPAIASYFHISIDQLLQYTAIAGGDPDVGCFAEADRDGATQPSPPARSARARSDIRLDRDWFILQDVNDTCEKLKLYEDPYAYSTTVGGQISEWEPLPELKHLQLLFAEHPYWGRELRYFNQAPWWYMNRFQVAADAGAYCMIELTNVDYYCKIWLNGVFLGEHEGYSAPIRFRADRIIRRGELNTLIVKVWSPWETKVDANALPMRTVRVVRNMVKGTYEHSDTFVQRDVNPVGIYGSVTVRFADGAAIDGRPNVTYTLDDTLTKAELTVSTPIAVLDDSKTYHLMLRVTNRQTGELCAGGMVPVTASGTLNTTLHLTHVELWNTWDKGEPWLYDVDVSLLCGELSLQTRRVTVGFRTIRLERDEQRTEFFLNKKRFYVRGTSYFPDCYISAMNRERYLRDLLNIRAAGFNFIRVHVHVENEIFYDLCSELGLGIMQDSEYNWMHPSDDEFCARFVKVYLENVDMLRSQPALLCWICLNEPGLRDPAGPNDCRAMTINPGPALVEGLREHDPSRPFIKGSYCHSDPLSGDSHNYKGSLSGGSYGDIYGTTEKLNTEFGFDAPPCLDDLKKCPELYRRLNGIEEEIDNIQDYQYHLTKFFLEHYRMQKYAPNGGYFQFLFSDLCPQSFYGLYDWWGLPKKGLQAVMESNMPVGVFLKHFDRIDGIYAVNDNDEPLSACTLRLLLTDSDGLALLDTQYTFDLGADTCLKVADAPAYTVPSNGIVHASLVLTQGTRVIAKNHYHDILTIRPHVTGHPGRMSHEYGMRLYSF